LLHLKKVYTKLLSTCQPITMFKHIFAVLVTVCSLTSLSIYFYSLLCVSQPSRCD